VLSGSPKRKNVDRDQTKETKLWEDKQIPQTKVHSHPQTQQVRVAAMYGTNPALPLTFAQ
jgi:hypothetical protein